MRHALISAVGRALDPPDDRILTHEDLRSTKFDGASRTRTGDLLGAIQTLSQLSYSPERPTV